MLSNCTSAYGAYPGLTYRKPDCGPGAWSPGNRHSTWQPDGVFGGIVVVGQTPRKFDVPPVCVIEYLFVNVVVPAGTLQPWTVMKYKPSGGKSMDTCSFGVLL